MIKFCILCQEKDDILQGTRIGIDEDRKTLLLTNEFVPDWNKFGFPVGTYDSYDRANEIIKEIFEKLKSSNNSTVFYEMPEK